MIKHVITLKIIKYYDNVKLIIRYDDLFYNVIKLIDISFA